jgi:ribosomal protein S18 acetylase RimI-like enzyme
MTPSESQIILKDAGYGDIHTIQEIMLKVWPQTYAPIISEDQINYMIQMMYSDQSLHHQMKDGHHFVLAFFDNIPVGYASFSRTDNWTTYKLHKLYIDLNIQRKGVGTALLNKIIQTIKSDHGKFLQLQVNRSNFHALDFYKKHGFFVIKATDMDIGNGFFMNDYILQKRLMA